MSIPTHFRAPTENDADPDTQETGTAPVAVVDTSRTKAKGDPDAQDAVWVCMIGGSVDDVSGPESRQAALQYVAANYGTASPSIDKTFGPMADDGSVQPPRNLNNLAAAPLTAGEYLRLAAMQNMSQKAKSKQFCYYIRVRRNMGI